MRSSCFVMRCRYPPDTLTFSGHLEARHVAWLEQVTSASAVHAVVSSDEPLNSSSNVSFQSPSGISGAPAFNDPPPTIFELIPHPVKNASIAKANRYFIRQSRSPRTRIRGLEIMNC